MLKISHVRAPRVHNKAPLADRVAYRIDGSGGPDACWPWTGVLDPKGYGHLRDQGRWLKAHRVTYALMRGPIPDGLQLDHLCHTRDEACLAARQCPHRRCVNPAHLEPVSLQENRKRGRSAPVRRPAVSGKRRPLKTHCVNGHPFDEANTLVTSKQRVCRTCNRLRARRRLARERELRD